MHHSSLRSRLLLLILLALLPSVAVTYYSSLQVRQALIAQTRERLLHTANDAAAAQRRAIDAAAQVLTVIAPLPMAHLSDQLNCSALMADLL